MDEIKELLRTISGQLASIDMKMSVVANSVQPYSSGRPHYQFGVPVLGTSPVTIGNGKQDPEDGG